MNLRRTVSLGCLLTLSAGFVAAQTPGERFVEAVKARDKTAVQALLQQRVDVNVADVDGTTPLHWAVHHEDVALATQLVRSGARVQAVNRYGVAPLSLACETGNASMVELLLEAGADPQTASREGETVLLTAARTGVTGVLQLLLARGADIKAKEPWREQTALMWAAAEGHVSAIPLLVASGADVQARSKGGMTPLLFAVRGGHIAAAEALVQAGANVNDTAPDGTSALALAIINAHYELAVRLLDRGADANIPDLRGSALHAVAWMRNPGYPGAPPRVPTGRLDSLDVAKSLLAHGADPNVRIAWKEIRFNRDAGAVKPPPNIPIGRNYMSFVGATPFYVAAKGADVALMRLLAASGADPLIPTVQKVTPLMAAAGLGFWDGESPGPASGVPEGQALEAVKLALELGNEVNAVTDFGDLHLEGDPHVLLRRHPFNLGEFPETALGDMRWGGSTALHGAALRGADSIVKFLIEQGATVDAKNTLGWTPLMVAEGVFVANTEKHWPGTVALLRRLASSSAASNAASVR